MLVSMTLMQLSKMFGRAFSYTLERKKNVFLFSMLTFAGIFILFFKGVALFADGWWRDEFNFFPLFISLGFILAAEVILVRLYAAQREGQPLEFRKTVAKSWELCFRISYFALPYLVLYLLFWVLTHLFFLLHAVPVVGTFLTIALSFAPFVLNLATLMLVMSAFFLCFYVCPYFALGSSKGQLMSRLRGNAFFIVLLFLIALIPVWLVYQVLTFAAIGTIDVQIGSMGKIVQSFVVMLPYLAVLTPIVVFFFNFAVEVHLYLEGDTENQDGYNQYYS